MPKPWRCFAQPGSVAFPERLPCLGVARGGGSAALCVAGFAAAHNRSGENGNTFDAGRATIANACYFLSGARLEVESDGVHFIAS